MNSPSTVFVSELSQLTAATPQSCHWREPKGTYCLILLASSLVVMSACSLELGPRGPYPKRTFTDLRTELVFDGKRIVIEGTSQCTRGSNFDSHGKPIGFVDSPSPFYRCSPGWLGKRLPNGGALLIGAYSIIGKWGTSPDVAPPELKKHRERIAKVPRAVIWLNNANSPSHGEYYYSAIAFEDQRSRLKAISTEIIGVRENGTSGRSVSDPAEEVPWVAGKSPPAYFLGQHANMIPKALWSTIPGLNNSLKKFRAPVFLSVGKDITDAQRRRLVELGLTAHESIHPHQWPAPQVTVFPVNSLLNSKDYFSLSLRRMPTRKIDGTLRLVSGLPKGILPMVGETESPQYRIVKLDVGGRTVAITNPLQILKPLYDPERGNIYRFFVARFTPGSNGDAYTSPLR